ncbi:putative protein S-acyltransferase 16 [Diplonema papillatum]|nr:putative protein S-acyltransferase 16 [Diplonema papillatum]|eukprot:gene6206-9503_t
MAPPTVCQRIGRVFLWAPVALIVVFVVAMNFPTQSCCGQAWTAPGLGAAGCFVTFVLEGLVLASFISASITNPGSVSGMWNSVQPSLRCHEKRRRDRNHRYCRKCCSFKPDRAHHCDSCGQCVLKMDHHCALLNNCVGHANHKFFILFVFYAAANAFWLFAFGFFLLENSAPGQGSLSSVCRAGVTISGVVAVAIGAVLSLFCAFLVYQVLANKTALEMMGGSSVLWCRDNAWGLVFGSDPWYIQLLPISPTVPAGDFFVAEPAELPA